MSLTSSGKSQAHVAHVFGLTLRGICGTIGLGWAFFGAVQAGACRFQSSRWQSLLQYQGPLQRPHLNLAGSAQRKQYEGIGFEPGCPFDPNWGWAADFSRFRTLQASASKTLATRWAWNCSAFCGCCQPPGDVAAAPKDAYLWGLVVEKETALRDDRCAHTATVRLTPAKPPCSDR